MQGGVVHAPGNAGHLDGIEIALAAQAVDERHLVRQRQHVVGGVQVTDRRVEVHGLHGVASHRMDGIEHLAQFEQVPVVVAVAVPTVPAQTGHERGAGHTGVGDDVAADMEVAFRVRSVQGEFGWSGGHQLLN